MKLRVLGQEDPPSPTRDLEKAWEGRQKNREDWEVRKERGEDVGEWDPFYYSDEVTLLDNKTQKTFTVFKKPDGKSLMIQQIVIKYEWEPFLEIPNLPDGSPDWNEALQAMHISDGNYEILPYGPGTNTPTTQQVRTSSTSVYKKALFNLLSGYSAKEEYIRRMGSD